MKYGFVGIHRTGKTTLAESVSHETDLPLVLTSTSKVIAEMGLDASKSMTLATRLEVQNRVLDAGIEAWMREASFITDRTPLDMIAYTMADITSGAQIPEHLEAGFERYIKDCYEALNSIFHGVMFVPPVIPVSEDKSKQTGFMGRAYRESLNMAMLGATVDPRNRSRTSYLSHSATHLHNRVSAAVRMIGQIEMRMMQEVAVSVLH